MIGSESTSRSGFISSHYCFLNHFHLLLSATRPAGIRFWGFLNRKSQPANKTRSNKPKITNLHLFVNPFDFIIIIITNDPQIHAPHPYITNILLQFSIFQLNCQLATTIHQASSTHPLCKDIMKLHCVSVLCTIRGVYVCVCVVIRDLVLSLQLSASLYHSLTLMPARHILQCVLLFWYVHTHVHTVRLVVRASKRILYGGWIILLAILVFFPSLSTVSLSLPIIKMLLHILMLLFLLFLTSNLLYLIA